jgi:WD40 repeat protein
MSVGKDDTGGIFDLTTGKLRVIKGHGANYYGGRFMPNGDRFVAATLLEGARVYSGSGQIVGTMHGHAGQGALDSDVNPAGTLLATAGKDAKATLWSLPGGKPVGNLVGHQDWVMAVRFSPNGKLIATSCGVDRSVRVWDVVTRRTIGTIDNSSGIGSPLCWTADGKYLVTRSVDDALVVNQITPSQSATAANPIHPVRRRRR